MADPIISDPERTFVLPLRLRGRTYHVLKISGSTAVVQITSQSCRVRLFEYILKLHRPHHVQYCVLWYGLRLGRVQAGLDRGAGLSRSRLPGPVPTVRLSGAATAATAGETFAPTVHGRHGRVQQFFDLFVKPGPARVGHGALGCLAATAATGSHSGFSGT